MRKTVMAAGVLATLLTGGCHSAVSPEVLRQWQSRTLYTCCNIHYEHDSITDADYYVGAILPFGSPVTIERMTDNAVTFTSGGKRLTLVHEYGTDQESAQQYFNKIFVETDPRERFATFPDDVRAAINDGRVEVGMTREQVIMSIGYPPTHRTPSLEQNDWTYWYNRWITYQVQFGPDGRVTGFIGRAPTHNQPIVSAPASPPPVRKVTNPRR